MVAPYQAYAICTSPRSGSTLLCKLLADTGAAGNPKSYFHPPSTGEWLRYFDLQVDATAPERQVLGEIFRAAIARGTRGGIFGFRLQRHSFPFFMERLRILHPRRSLDAERFHDAFGRTLFIHLTRHDKIEQAVSYVKAQQTGLWHAAPDGTELERLSPAKEPTYRFDAIRTCVEEVTTFDREWESWFQSQAIEPLRIAYEDLSVAPHDSLAEVLEALGLAGRAADAVSPGIAKLADETNRDWVARFRREYASG